MKFILGMITGILLSTFFFIWYAKKNLVNHNTTSPEPMTATINDTPDDFVEFYNRFHSDSLFQISHIVFPLEGVPPRDSTGGFPEDFRWQEENWILHKPFNNQDSTFVQYFNRLSNDMVIDQIMDAKGMFGMQRRFARIGKEWHLIYYEAMNQLAEE